MAFEGLSFYEPKITIAGKTIAELVDEDDLMSIEDTINDLINERNSLLKEIRRLRKEIGDLSSSIEKARITTRDASVHHDDNMIHEDEVIANKGIRKAIDHFIQQIKALPPSRERSLAITKLQEGVMWLGMDLKRLNESNPYPSSKDPSTGDKIEPTADGLKL